MKTIIIILVLAFPCGAFSQAMHLPGAYFPIQASGKKKPALLKTDSLKKPDSSQFALLKKGNFTIVDTSAKMDSTPSGTALAPIRYKATVLSTNFTIPLVRINLLNNKPQNASNANVSTSFLNSAGAGFNYSWGEIDRTLDSNGNTASTDYYNRFGFQIGFLFASNSSSGTSTTTTNTTTSSSNQSSTIFAVVAGVSILNFQLGGGYEFGSVASGQKRLFFTLAYAIPMSTLINGGYKIFHLQKLDANTTY